MKKVSSVIAFVMLVGSFGLYACSADKGPLSPNFDGMEIKNFSSYKALAVGETKPISVKTMSQNYVTAKAEGNKESKLLGVEEDGQTKEIEFQSSGGTAFRQEWGIDSAMFFDNFTFVRYTQEKGEVRICDYLDCAVDWEPAIEVNYYTYAIDNKSGKIFDLKSITEAILEEEDKKSSFVVFFNDYMENGDYTYLSITLSCNTEAIKEKYNGYYRLTANGDSLAVEKILSDSQCFYFFGETPGTHMFRYTECDKFGNVYSNLGESFDMSHSDSYILRKDGSISSLNDYKKEYGIFRAANGIVYCTKEGETKYFNEEGNLAVSDFIPPTDFYPNIYGAEGMVYTCFCTTANAKYYMPKHCFGGEIPSIYKFTFKDEVEFEYEEFSLSNSEQSPVFANGKLYSISNESVHYYNIDTGEKTVLTTDYRFETLTAGLDGRLYFKGLTDSLDEVYGSINPDDTLSIGIKPLENNFEVIYVKAIN